jgi:hypothetical protein
MLVAPDLKLVPVAALTVQVAAAVIATVLVKTVLLGKVIRVVTRVDKLRVVVAAEHLLQAQMRLVATIPVMAAMALLHQFLAVL